MRYYVTGGKTDLGSILRKLKPGVEYRIDVIDIEKSKAIKKSKRARYNKTER